LNNPVEIILRGRERLARLAAIRALLQVVFPLTVTLAIALGLNKINVLAFVHFGYLLDAAAARLFQMSLLGLAFVQLVAVAIFAWRAWLHASDFMWASEQIDRLVHGRQEIVTLATLSDPARPQARFTRGL